jgi:hypothetical protein
MPSRILYLILVIASLGMLLLVLGFIGFQFGWVDLTSRFYSLASKALLISFGLFFVFGVISLVCGLFDELRAYFRREAVALRRVWSLQAQKIHQAQQTTLQLRQLRYLQQLKHRRLQEADNKKQLHALYKSIYQELNAERLRFTSKRYQTLLKLLRQHHKQADAKAMLALREQIICR